MQVRLTIHFQEVVFHQQQNYHDLVFDCYSPVILKSVKVYATGSGNRTITLIQNGDIAVSHRKYSGWESH